jgi:hypothetical protein
MATLGSMRYSKNCGDLHSTVYRSGLYSTRSNNSYNSFNNYNSKQSSGKLKWKEIVCLDIDSIIRNNDFAPLAPFLDNLVYSTIDESDLHSVPEHSIVKIFRTFQNLMEHFLSRQTKLETENKHLETSYNQLFHDCTNKDSYCFRLDYL